jgi:hypothetical protein
MPVREFDVFSCKANLKQQGVQRRLIKLTTVTLDGVLSR